MGSQSRRRGRQRLRSKERRPHYEDDPRIEVVEVYLGVALDDELVDVVGGVPDVAEDVVDVAEDGGLGLLGGSGNCGSVDVMK